MIQLFCDILKTDDRPRDQLWKQRNIGSKRNKILLHFSIPTIHIDRIGHRLKGIKRNTDWQCKMQLRHRQTGQLMNDLKKKTGIFKKAKKCQIYDCRTGNHNFGTTHFPLFFKIMHRKSRRIVYTCRKQDEYHIYRFAPRIKNETRQK